MRPAEQPWRFVLNTTANERTPILDTPRTFAEVSNLVASQLRVLCCHRSQVSGTEFRRPVYTVEVARWLFDVLFNSQYGYRAAYFRSPGLGLDANAHLMRTVAPVLIADLHSADCGLPTDMMKESLATPSAKVWLAEHGKEIERKCAGCKGEWSIGSSDGSEIRNGRWEITAGQRAEWGRQAPYLTKLRFMGAFVDDRFAEYVPYDKRFRSNDISHFGWS